MKKTHLLIVVALACVMLFALVGSAFAGTAAATKASKYETFTVTETRAEVLPNGVIALTELKVNGHGIKDAKLVAEGKVAATKGMKLSAMASGTGGTALSSGYSNAYIKTSYYWGNHSFLLSFKSWYYWTFSGGRVTAFYNKTREIVTNNAFGYRLVSATAGTPIPMSWNGRANGQYYSWQQAVVRISCSIAGDLAEYRPYHQLYGHYNGTWYWIATP